MQNQSTSLKKKVFYINCTREHTNSEEICVLELHGHDVFYHNSLDAVTSWCDMPNGDVQS